MSAVRIPGDVIVSAVTHAGFWSALNYVTVQPDARDPGSRDYAAIRAGSLTALISLRRHRSCSLSCS